MTSTDVMSIQEIKVRVADAMADYRRRHAGTVLDIAADTIGTYGPYGYEVQRNSLCAYIANASKDMAANYADALRWSMAHPEVTA